MIKSNHEINMYVHLCAKTMIWPVFKTKGLSKQAKRANFVTWTRWGSVYSSIQNGYFLNCKFVGFFGFVKHQIYLDLLLRPPPKNSMLYVLHRNKQAGTKQDISDLIIKQVWPLCPYELL